MKKHAVPKRKQNRGISRIEIPQTIVIVIVLGMVAGLAVMIKQTYEISLLAGNTNGLASMLEYARKMYIIPGYTIGKASIHISLLGKHFQRFFYISLSIISMQGRTGGTFFIFFPVVLYLCMAALGTGRTFMIRVFRNGHYFSFPD